MNLEHYNKLDQLLTSSDCDSLAWNEDGQFELAEGILAVFEDEEWGSLVKVWQAKNSNWKRCLASLLTPYYGEVAQDILIDMANTKNPEVAMEAMYAISFYCGINENDEGLYRDNTIVHEDFKNKLIKRAFVHSISKIEKIIGEKFNLLNEILNESGL